eukprot:gnl/TRDRNA2_/TRDRNA2_166324_c1_seq1.p1 gnl/TRDRNA2_/TRDRNA2_166324_c1~~gnl/TRDRNA2_/TRDRNA2_166324_c1_seq1.p1  ORF type:complete len:297 (-),score=33.87 gnl/TRDRNA2_/TRDRNA2_166324_c1_seq1:20-910(-)
MKRWLCLLASVQTSAKELAANLTVQNLDHALHGKGSGCTLGVPIVAAPRRLANKDADSRSHLPSTQAKSMDLVIFKLKPIKPLFRKVVRSFQPPSKAWMSSWTWLKQHYEAKILIKGKDTTLVVAMNGQKPCAVGVKIDTEEVWPLPSLNRLLRNEGDDCKGAGAVILCHYIQNNRNKAGEFVPLRLWTDGNEKLRPYWASFGCVNHTDIILYHCFEQNPERCEHHATNKIYMANDHPYFIPMFDAYQQEREKQYQAWKAANATGLNRKRRRENATAHFQAVNSGPGLVPPVDPGS